MWTLTRLLVIWICIWSSAIAIEQSTVLRNETVIIYVKLNDRVLLSCDYLNETSINADTTATNETTATVADVKQADEGDLTWRLVLFKKDSVLLKLHNSKVDLIIRNQSDEGLYECGYYYLDSYANLNYNTTRKWSIRVVAKRVMNQDSPLDRHTYILHETNDTNEIEEELQAFEIRSTDLATLKSSVLVYWFTGFCILIIITILVYLIKKYNFRSFMVNYEKPIPNELKEPINGERAVVVAVGPDTTQTIGNGGSYHGETSCAIHVDDDDDDDDDECDGVVDTEDEKK